MIASASAAVVRSGTMGPEAIFTGSSPSTSEMARVSTGAGHAATIMYVMADGCLRAQFISPIEAGFEQAAVISLRLSTSDKPSAARRQRTRRRRKSAPAFCDPAHSELVSFSVTPAEGREWVVTAVAVRDDLF